MVIEALWQALERFGLSQGANILEPSMGVGHFFGLMPDSMLPGCRRTGIELDGITARIAKQLYPDATIFAKGLEETSLPDNFFDAVIGNPPWDMVRADAGSANARARSRDDISLFLRFTRDSGAYDSQSDGHANRYQLFLERAMSLTRTGGRLGLVLPSGLATDHGSSRLRSRLLGRCDVDALVGFDNRRGVFPIHRSVRFLLLTATAGSPTRTIACRLGEHDPAVLEGIGDEPADVNPSFPLRITTALLERISGAELTIPDLRSAVDLAIAERAATLFAPLGSHAGWTAHFGRELNATDDRAHFHDAGCRSSKASRSSRFTSRSPHRATPSPATTRADSSNRAATNVRGSAIAMWPARQTASP